MSEESSNNNNNNNNGQGLGFRWSIHNSIDPHLHVASNAPRRLREDLHQVIRGLSPLVERSQHINLSTWLQHSRSHEHSPDPDTGPASRTSHSSEETSGLAEFVIDVYSESSDNAAEANGEDSTGTTSSSTSTATNNNTSSNGESSVSQQADVLRHSPELRAIISVVEKYLPYLFILLFKLVFDHKTGILVLIGLIVTFTHANAVVKREVGKQNKRNLGSLLAVTINLLTCVFFIYYVFESDKLYYSLFCMLPNREHPMTFWNLLWIVSITDFVLKLITILFKTIIIALPAQVIAFQKKGKYYLFIEQTSQLYRSFMPVQPWLVYLMEAYEGAGKIMGVILSAAYIVSKGKNVIKKLKSWKSSFSKLMQSVSYGSKPSKEQIESSGNICPICQDDFRHPTMLQCKHIFCEECVVIWFDRERTCPMCRAQIADDPTWRDGTTTFFFQLF